MAYGNVFVGDACMVEMSEWGQILLKWGCHFLVFAHICAFRLENFYLHMQAHFFKFLCMCVHFNRKILDWTPTFVVYFDQRLGTEHYIC